VVSAALDRNLIYTGQRSIGADFCRNEDIGVEERVYSKEGTAKPST
jgi:hypothetical protein